MAQARRQFTDDFKREAVALLVSSGRPLTYNRRRRHRGCRDEASLGNDLTHSKGLISLAGSRWPNRNDCWLQQPTERMIPAF